MSVRQMMAEISSTGAAPKWRGSTFSYGFDLGVFVEFTGPDGLIKRLDVVWYSTRSITSMSPLKVARNLMRMFAALCRRVLNILRLVHMP